MTLYSFVRHTGWSVGEDPSFRQAVEMHVVGVNTAKAAIKHGGLVFDDWAEANRAEEIVNYPVLTYLGLIPHARGTFKHVTSFSHLHELYLPSHEDRESLAGFLSEVST